MRSRLSRKRFRRFVRSFFLLEYVRGRTTCRNASTPSSDGFESALLCFGGLSEGVEFVMVSGATASVTPSPVPQVYPLSVSGSDDRNDARSSRLTISSAPQAEEDRCPRIRSEMSHTCAADYTGYGSARAGNAISQKQRSQLSHVGYRSSLPQTLDLIL